LYLNNKYGKELVFIHHKEQPLRASIIDDNIVYIKEIKEPTFKEGELMNKVFLFYRINDKDWIKWVSKIFWKMFNSSIDAQKRLEEISRLKIT
jgi:hypothetical protein